MNRTALGLAVGAGYLLGRTKKLKMALAVGSLVAGKKLNLSPRMVADLVNQQLKNNPQFKEIGDQLRQDLRGVGKAASGAVAERQINALADRLHGRTAQVRDQLSGIAPSGSDEEPDEEEGEEGGRQESAGDRGEDRREKQSRGEGSRDGERARKAPAKKTAAKKAAAKKTAPAKKTAAKKTSATRKTAAKKTASAGEAASGAASRQSKGGDDR
ncbi:DNA primase [Streptomyces cinerochromogenes]|uniref:DNA primase n=1 Tax=Streptomyces cinerochromogenes TaxID=66422 RepID=UPI0033AC09F8